MVLKIAHVGNLKHTFFVVICVLCRDFQYVKSSLGAQCTVRFFILCPHKQSKCCGSFSSGRNFEKKKTNKKEKQQQSKHKLQPEWLSAFCVNCVHCWTGQCVTINISSVSNDILARGHERLRWEAAPVNQLAGIYWLRNVLFTLKEKAVNERKMRCYM